MLRLGDRCPLSCGLTWGALGLGPGGRAVHQVPWRRVRPVGNGGVWALGFIAGLGWRGGTAPEQYLQTHLQEVGPLCRAHVWVGPWTWLSVGVVAKCAGGHGLLWSLDTGERRAL